MSAHVTLQRRLVRSLLVVFAVLGVAAAAVVVQVGSLAALPPRILADNFRSVEDCEEMDRALALLLIDPHDAVALSRFRRALDDELGNITEPGEAEAAQALARDYHQLLGAPSPEHARALQQSIRAVYDLNERAILAKDRSAVRVAAGLRVSILALLLVALVVGVFVATRAARSIARPLVDM